jgi:glycosyltransferase involved in cell wall biosynthesis
MGPNDAITMCPVSLKRMQENAAIIRLANVLHDGVPVETRSELTSFRIAMTVDPEIPVPPQHYGGIERIVDVLVRGLVQRGHQVTLFANPASEVPCRILPCPVTNPHGAADMLCNMAYISSSIVRLHFDLIHSFGRLAHIAPLLPLRTPKIMSYQRPVTPRCVRWGEVLSRGSLHVTGCSKQLIAPWIHKQNFHVIYNAVPIERYAPVFQVAPDAPLVYLGRIAQIKGVHLAIEVARRSGRKLIIAGNVPNLDTDTRYFVDQIKPRIDWEQIHYMGAVDDEQKNELLGRAAAMVLPLQWDEPFGIVMVEALACGTPVIGLRRGALPEIVDDGITGFVCDSIEDMVSAVSRLQIIDRRACRCAAEAQFSDHVLVRSFERLYEEIV